VTEFIRRRAPLPALILFVLTLALVTLSLIMVYSSSGFIDGRARHDPFFHFKHQVVWVLMGLVGLFLAARTDYQRLARVAKPLLAVSFVLLMLCYVPGIGLKVNGQTRWIRVAGFTFQPSELAKLAMVLFMADTLARKRHLLRSFTLGFLPAATITGIFLLAIVLEEDLGATFVLGLIVWLLWFVAGMRITHLVSLVIAAIPAFAFFVLSSQWRVMRMIAFLNPEHFRSTHGMQLDQSLIAFGSGGVFGRGLGHGLQKYYFLVEGHTDFIFANIGEELGMIGCIAVIAAFLTIIAVGTTTALRMPDLFGSLLACGLTLMIGVPAMVNMAVVLGLLPTKGLPLPLISYGGSQILVNMTAMGILMNIVYHRQRTVDVRRRRRI
jgi:cell division protein FtsW